MRISRQRDGIERVTKVANQYTHANQSDSGYENLGSWTYAYDSASNPTNMLATGTTMGKLESSNGCDTRRASVAAHHLVNDNGVLK